MCEYVPDRGLRLVPTYDPLIIKGKTPPPGYTPGYTAADELARVSPSALTIADLRNALPDRKEVPALPKEVRALPEEAGVYVLPPVSKLLSNIIITLLLLLLALTLAYIALIVCSRIYSIMNQLAEGCGTTETITKCEERCFEYTQENEDGWSDEQITDYCANQCMEVRTCKLVHHNRKLALAAVIVLGILAFMLLAVTVALLMRSSA